MTLDNTSYHYRHMPDYDTNCKGILTLFIFSWEKGNIIFSSAWTKLVTFLGKLFYCYGIIKKINNTEVYEHVSKYQYKSVDYHNACSVPYKLNVN